MVKDWLCLFIMLVCVVGGYGCVVCCSLSFDAIAVLVFVCKVICVCFYCYLN